MKKDISKKDIVIKIISVIIMALLAIFSIFIIIAIVIFGSLIYSLSFDTRTIETFTNENNNYTIKFQEIGCAAFFGPTKVKVILYNDKKRKIDQFTTPLFNDGKSPTKDNISVIWLDDRVKIIIDGEEQPEEIHEINYRKWEGRNIPSFSYDIIVLEVRKWRIKKL